MLSAENFPERTWALTFNFSKRIYGITFICRTVSLEVFCKAAVITLVEINIGKKMSDSYFPNLIGH
jgi:predicted acyltransferase